MKKDYYIPIDDKEKFITLVEKLSKFNGNTMYKSQIHHKPVGIVLYGGGGFDRLKDVSQYSLRRAFYEDTESLVYDVYPEWFV